MKKVEVVPNLNKYNHTVEETLNRAYKGKLSMCLVCATLG